VSIVCLGLSHRTAPAEVRERHTFPSSAISEALVGLLDYEAVREAAILSTCGRLEIYAAVDDFEIGIAQLKQFLASFRHAGMEYDIEPYLYTLLGSDAVHHLFRVSTGLDSMLIGEAEILGQIKEAYSRAQKAGSFGKSLHRLFREALNAGKAARSQTAIGGASVSIATAAVAVAKEHVGTLRGKIVLLVGAGKMAQKAANRLKQEGAGTLMVANRTRERAVEVVERLGSVGQVVELPSLHDALKSVDVVITSTGASHFILTPENVAEGMAARRFRPLCIVDIAVPRDVHPEVAAIPGVRVVDIDQLGATVDTTLEQRRQSIPSVEEIVDEHLARFTYWHRSRAAHPVISLLSQKADAIREAEVHRILSRCPELTERQRMLLTGMSIRIISKLMHSAYSGIRDTAVRDAARAAAQAAVVDELFSLGLEEAEVAGPAPKKCSPAVNSDVVADRQAS
jgi:glutamyl-tRNA reductase